MPADNARIPNHTSVSVLTMHEFPTTRIPNHTNSQPHISSKYGTGIKKKYKRYASPSPHSSPEEQPVLRPSHPERQVRHRTSTRAVLFPPTDAQESAGACPLTMHESPTSTRPSTIFSKYGTGIKIHQPISSTTIVGPPPPLTERRAASAALPPSGWAEGGSGYRWEEKINGADLTLAVWMIHAPARGVPSKRSLLV